MTAYSKEGHQDNLAGMVGTLAEDGITCEECHGPGMDHLRNPVKETIKKVTEVDLCGKCHQRAGTGPETPASKGGIRHHEQINELKAGAHGELSCVECHDPHERAILVKKNLCADCHGDIAAGYTETVHGKQGTKCIECHMPKASKSSGFCIQKLLRHRDVDEKETNSVRSVFFRAVDHVGFNFLVLYSQIPYGTNEKIINNKE